MTAPTPPQHPTHGAFKLDARKLGALLVLIGVAVVVVKLAYKPPVEMGGSCAHDDDCQRDLRCVDVGAAKRQCTQPCRWPPRGPDTRCPAGFTCVDVRVGGGDDKVSKSWCMR